MGKTVFERFPRFVRVADFLVKLGDVGSDFLLGLGFRLAGEHFAPFDSLLVKVPDDALPAAIGTAEDIAVCCESLLWHGWRFLPSGVLFNHQHYRIALNYVQTYVVSGVEKISSGFWWIYTCLGRGNLYGPILCLLPCNF